MDLIPKKYDVIIVGAGVAGSSAALLLSREGFKVALIDSKPWDRAGDKPCGDAIGKHHFDEVGIKPPSGEDLDGFVRGILLYSPSEEVVLRIEGEGYEINRVKFTQRLIREAVDLGAEYFGGTKVSEPIIEGGFVRGVKIFRGDSKTELRAPVTIDASGNSRSIIQRLPNDWPIVETLDPRDSNIAYREIRELQRDVEEPEFIKIYVSNKVAPGGYWWDFPKSKYRNVTNVGIGVQGGMGYGHPRDYLYKYVLVREEYKNSRIIESGGALVPTRRPLSTMAWNGVIAIGDAAFTVNPVHGGGKGSGMLSAKASAEAIKKAFEMGDFSARGLWNVNKLYIRYYGAKQASLDIFRIFLQKLSDDDIEYGLRKRIMRESDLYETSSTGVIRRSVFDKLERILAGLGRPSLLYKLAQVASYMEKIRRLYEEYPEDPQKIYEWIEKIRNLYSEFTSVVLR
ncbi:MAG: digeranylgeranylglycerophospholipid reductase [Sulfolobales archaeon]